MIYLSRLLLNPRSSRIRADVRSPYEMHRSLGRAFSYDRPNPPKVMFRVESQTPGAQAIKVLVQSDEEPRWMNTTWSGGDFVELPEVKPVDMQFTRDQILRFHLRANPTKRVKESGKRIALLAESDQIAWMIRKGEEGGFKVTPSSIQVLEDGFQRTGKRYEGNQPQRMVHFGVLFDGLLKVTDTELFKQTVERGIGAAKGLGFGMLSLSRPR